MNKQDTVTENNRTQYQEQVKSLRDRYLPSYSTPNNFLDKTLITSNYVGDQLSKKPQLVDIINQKQLVVAVDDTLCHNRLKNYYSAVNSNIDTETFAQSIRQFRHEMMIRIIARMANNFATTEQTLRETSCLACFCIHVVLEHIFKVMCQKHGEPKNNQGETQELLIIAMGKLGGMELNLSSDVDLIFAYPQEGKSQHPTHSLENRIFFSRLAQRLLSLLSEQTNEGFVYRVDMRLRPYGSSGSLVASFSDLQKYYQEQAREWERFAMARSCIISGKAAFRTELQEMVDDFVYRKYVDFSVLSELRTIKMKIRKETLHHNKNNDIKLGRGGIREIEFIAQTFQLIYGGRKQKIHSSSTQATLHTIVELHLLDKTTIDQLKNAYLYLRKLENYIQAKNDAQTHTLPIESNEQNRLALALGYDCWHTLARNCQQKRDSVQTIFDNLVLGDSDTKTTDKLKLDSKWIELANTIICKQPDTSLITNSFINENNQQLIIQLLNKAQKSSSETQELCQKILPFLLQGANYTKQPEQALEKLITLMNSILRRSVYIRLIDENKKMITLLSHMLVLSNWLYKQLCLSPALLESFIHIDQPNSTANKQQLSDSLHSTLSGVAETDEEQQIDAIRYFANELQFQTALKQLTQAMPITKVSDTLTYTAEACIEHAYHMAWNYLTKKHGVPEDNEKTGFAVIAYGKLGGLELNYSSDLDLVFLFSGSPQTMTQGLRSISLPQFYFRLAQRIIHILSTPTSVGNGYQLDTRLRPQGSKGLLVNSIHGLDDYLLTAAWTWEHQALVRSRPITGDKEAIEQFNQLRKKVLCRQRNIANLYEDVQDMRKRINTIKHDTDIKHGAGGLVDIEFLVQFLVLANAHKHPNIVRYSDNLRQLQTLAKAEIISDEQAKTLITAYLELRSETHQQALELGKSNNNVPAYHSQQVQLIQQQLTASLLL